MKSNKLEIITIIILFLASTILWAYQTKTHKEFDDREEQSEYYQSYENKYDELIRNIDSLGNNFEPRLIRVDATSLSEATLIASQFKGKISTFSNYGYAIIRLSGSDTIHTVIEKNRNTSLLNAIHPVTHIKIKETLTYNDTYYDYQTYLEEIRAEQAWVLTKGQGVKVAVIDTGVDIYHPDLQAALSNLSYNASTKMVGIEHVHETISNHGTAISGIISASHNNEGGILGIAPESELIFIKADYTYGFFYDYDLIEGIFYAVDQGAKVINISWGTLSSFNPFATAIAYAHAHGVIMVGSAGNYNMRTPIYPTYNTPVISVGAMDELHEGLASYSNYGEFVDLVSTGTTFTTALNGSYDFVHGTSFSAPTVVGAIALYLSINPESTYDEIYQMLIHTTTDIGHQGRDTLFSFGLLNIEKFITSEKIQLTFYMNDNTGSVVNRVFPKDSILLDSPKISKDGYTFGGWFHDEALTEPIFVSKSQLSQDMNLYAKWEKGINETHIDYFVHHIEDNFIVIDYYIGKDKTIKFPESFNGYSVKSIGSYAFYLEDYNDLIIFNSAITSIGSYAFQYSSVKQVFFPEDSQLEIIGYCGFSHAQSLSSIILPDSLITIGSGAFEVNTNLESITIGKSVRYISDTAFLFQGYEATRFAAIHVSEENPYYSSLDGVLFDKEFKTLLKYPIRKTDKFYKIPDSVETIGRNAFHYNAYIEILEFGESLSYIESHFSLAYMKGIQQFRVSSDNQFYTSIDGILYSKDLKVLIKIPNNYQIDELVVPQQTISIESWSIDSDLFIINRSAVDKLVFLGSLQDSNLMSELEYYDSSKHKPILHILDILQLYTVYSQVMYAVDQIFVHEDSYNYLTHFINESQPRVAANQIFAYNELVIVQSTVQHFYRNNEKIAAQVKIMNDDYILDSFRFYKALNNSLLSYQESQIYSLDYCVGSLSININMLPTVRFVTNTHQHITDIRVSVLGETLLVEQPIPKKGHIFDGWYLDSNLINEFHSDITPVDDDITLYAKWNKISYDVRYYDGELIKEETIEFDQIIDFKPDKEGYIFKGWFVLNNNIDSYYLSRMPDYDLNLYAIWEDQLDRNHLEKFRYKDIGDFYIITDYIGDEDIIELPYFYYGENELPEQGKYVTGIDHYAFFRSQVIKHVYLSHYIKYIGDFAFSEITSLNHVIFNSQLEDIGFGAFRKSSIKSISITPYLERIQGLAFHDALSLESIDFTNALRIDRLEVFAFLNTSGLKTIDLPDTITFIGMGAFLNAKNVTHLKLPKYLSTIESSTFYNLRKMKTVIMPEVLEVVQAGSFGYNGLTELYLPDTLKEIKRGAFTYSDSLETLYLGENVSFIGPHAFYMNLLQEINLGPSVETLHSTSFSESYLSESINVDERNPYYKSEQGVLYNFNMTKLMTYPSNKMDKVFIVPDSVKVINSFAFASNMNIEGIILPEGLRTIGASAFLRAKNLSSINLPEGLTNISQNTFENTNSLKRLVLPESLVSIESLAFQYSGIEELYIPDQTQLIQWRAFYYAYHLRQISLPDNVQISRMMFDYNHRLEMIFFRGDMKSEVSSSMSEFLRYSPVVSNIYVHSNYETNLKNLIAGSNHIDKIKAYDVINQNDNILPVNSNEELANKEFELIKNSNVIGHIPLKMIMHPNQLKTANSKGIHLLTISIKMQSFEIEVHRNILIKHYFNIDYSLEDMYLIDAVYNPPISAEHYNFVGWFLDEFYELAIDLSTTNLINDMTLYGKFEPKMYTIEFKDYDGRIITSEIIAYGETIESPEMGTRIGYRFIGWDQSFDTVEGDMTIMALYEVNTYHIYYYEADGVTLIDVYGYVYGESLAEHQRPQASSQVGHTFNGWEDLPETMPAQDLIYSASYSINIYTVTFKDEDGVTILQTSEVEYGGKAIAPEAPTKAATQAYQYLFDGWDKSYDYIESDLTIKATYVAIIKMYTIEFKDYDGRIITSEIIAYGETIESPEMGTRIGYRFIGWDQSFDTVEGDMTIMALYEVNTYHIYYYEADGVTLIDVYGYVYGESLAEHQRPQASSQVGHTFNGWEDLPETMPAQDLIYSASYSINIYTVTFKDEDGVTILQTSEVEYGGKAIAPEAPTKAATQAYQYLFDGWDKSYDYIESDLTIKATYVAIIKMYTIEFKDYDGRIITSEIIAYGETIESPEMGTRIGYRFIGWDQSFDTVEGDMTIMALYEVNTYHIYYYEADGVTLIDVYGYVYGESLAEHQRPQASSQVGHTFNGWEDLPETMPAQDLIYSASYSINIYTVTFKDEDGVTILQTSEVEYGGKAIAPEAPTKAATQAYQYLFDGWDKSYDYIESDLTIKATYVAIIKMYTIEFKDYDGRIITSEIIAYGETIESPEMGTRIGYRFIGWDQSFDTVEGDMTIMALYEVNTYHIYYYEADGVTLIDVYGYVYGESLAEHQRPQASSQVGHTFNGWEDLPETMPAQDLIYSASYSINIYTVTFKDEDGVTILQTSEVEYGGKAIAPEAPTKAATQAYQYLFDGWDKSYDYIESDLTIKATYVAIIKMYTIEFKDYDGRIITSEIIAYGETIESPEMGTRIGYRFIGWDQSFDTVEGDMTIMALYEVNTYHIYYYEADGVTLIDVYGYVYGESLAEHQRPQASSQVGHTFNGWEDLPETMPAQDLIYSASYSINIYTVTFKDEDGVTILQTSEVEYGGKAIAPEAPTKAATQAYQYLFDGWDKSYDYIESDLTIKATYVAIIKMYTIEFKDYDGRIITSEIIAYGETIESPEMGTRIGYRFIGWDQSFDTVEGDMTIMALYEVNTYHIYYYEADGVTLIDVYGYVYGESLAEHQRPQASSQVGHTFNGWEDLPETMPAQDLIYSASYSINIYTVTFKDEDGVTILQTSEVEYGGKAIAPEAPTKAATQAYQYLFDGWDKSYDYIESDLTIKALYRFELLDHQNLINPGIDHLDVNQSWIDTGIGLFADYISYVIEGEELLGEAGTYLITYHVFYKDEKITTYYRHVHLYEKTPEVLITLNPGITTIMQNEVYEDSGAQSAYGQIEVFGEVDTTKPGTYRIEYIITINNQVFKKSRYVTVLESEPIIETKFVHEAILFEQKRGWIA
jgi:uncharacterized repeat protein (TIGR02543 family)